MPKSWLPPKVWLHGGQSTKTGGSSARNGRPQRIIDWLAHSISCVLITPFGWPVEPEVKSIFAIVSGPTLACAVSTAAVGVVAASSANNVALRFGGGFAVTTISIPSGTVAAIARENAAPLAAKTRPG